MRLNPGRLAAGLVLMEVEEGRHADRALARLAPPPGRDRALAWQLVLGVLRHLGELDGAIDAVSKRPVDTLDPPVRAGLRVATWERLFGRAPDHAVVDQGVALVHALGAPQAKGFANAVLRRVAVVEVEPTSNHPAWWVDRWTERAGAEAVADWCRRNDSPAPLGVVARDDPDAVAAQLAEVGQVEPATVLGVPVPGAFLVTGLSGAIDVLPGFAEGAWWVMDPSSCAAADLLPITAGDRVLDACAAPGGKALRLAARGARVMACDLDSVRLRTLKANAKRTGLGAITRQVDWLDAPWTPKVPFDAALVDAPCTGLGTLRRHPEIRWARQPTDPAAMALRQVPILTAAAATVRPGGVLVYSVCSPEPEEGKDLVAAWVESASGQDWTLDEQCLAAPPVEDADCFYAALLRRSE